MPKFVLGIVFGTANRPSMSYEALAAKYEGVLDKGGKAGGRFVPPAVPQGRRQALLGLHRRATARLIAQIDKFSEAELDRYIARLVAIRQPALALALYRKEIDRNPNDPGLYERLAAFLAKR